jgi:hypothetical protein
MGSDSVESKILIIDGGKLRLRKKGKRCGRRRSIGYTLLQRVSKFLDPFVAALPLDIKI